MNKKLVSYFLIAAQLLQYIFIPIAYASSNKSETAPEFEYNQDLTSLAGTLASQGNDGEVDTIVKKEAVNFINTKAEKYITKETELWLSQYGTAKIDVELDEFLKLKSGELDLLIPFFTKETGLVSSTWFVQPGVIFNNVSNYDGRDFVHIGLGYRKKEGPSFFGLNAFYDYDLTRTHQRASFGAEYARQYFKLNTNYYFPLNSWKESPNRFNSIGSAVLLDERPAQGIDFNFSGYLPQIPWISLDTTYQQFFGEHVETSNGNDPVDNPFVVTGALNFQPVSLFSMKTGYTLEKGGREELIFGASLAYQLGVPIEKQLSMSNVSNMKALEFQLLNLVERDHNIRLEYKQATTPIEISFKSTQLSIEEQSAIALSEWMSVSGDQSQVQSILFSGDGALYVQDNKIFTAPQFDPSGTNVYSLNATLTLMNGEEKTTPAPTSIIVKENRVSSTIKDRDITISAVNDSNSKIGMVGNANNPNAGIHISVTVHNELGRPIQGKKVTFSTKTNTASFKDLELTTSEEGVVSTILYSTAVASVKFNVTVDDFSYADEASFDDKNSPPSVVTSSVKPSDTTISANGISETTLTLDLQDEYGNPLLKRTVLFTLYKKETPDVPVIPGSTSGIAISETVEKGNGVYTSILRGTVKGVFIIKSTVAEVPNFEVLADITLNVASAIPSTTHSTINATKLDINADGTDETQITLNLKDQFKNPLVDREVHFKAFRAGAPINEGLTITRTTEINGIYTTTLKGTSAGPLTVKATVVGVGEFEKSIDLSLILLDSVQPSESNSSFKSSKNIVSADGVDSTKLTLILKDKHGNILSNKKADLTFKAERFGNDITENLGITISVIEENEKGTYTATVKGTSAGLLTIKPIIKGMAQFNLSVAIDMNTDQIIPSTRTSVLSSSKIAIEANNLETSIVTLDLRDRHGNSLPGREVLFKAYRNEIDFTNNPGIKISAVTNPTGTGTYTATLAGSIAGKFLIKAIIVGVSGFEEITHVELTVALAEPSEAVSTITSQFDTIRADGIESSKITLQLFDAFSNPLSKRIVEFKALRNGVDITADGTIEISPVTVNNNEHSITLKGTSAGPLTIEGSLKGISTFKIRVNITLNTDSATPAAAQTTFVADNPIVTSDDADYSEITLSLKDKFGNSLANRPVLFTAFRDNVEVSKGITIFNISNDGTGNYSARVRGTSAGHFIVKATIEGTNNFHKQIALELKSDGAPSSHFSSIALSRTTIDSNGFDSSALNLLLKDGHGNNLQGKTPLFSAYLVGQSEASPDVRIAIQESSQSGLYTALVTGTKSGDYIIKAHILDIPSTGFEMTTPLTLTSINALPSLDHSRLSASKAEIIADGADTNVFTLELRDVNGNPLEKRNVVFQIFEDNIDVTSSPAFTLQPVESKPGGNYEAMLYGRKAAILTLKVTITDIDLFEMTHITKLVVSKNAFKKSAFKAAKQQTQNKPALKGTLPGPLSFDVEISGVNQFYSPFKEIESQNASTKRIFNNKDNSANKAKPWARNSNLIASNANIKADNIDSTVLTLLLKDEFGNPIFGENVIFDVYLHDALLHSGITISRQSEGINGSYNAILTGSVVGTITIKAKIRGVDSFEASTTLTLK